MDEAEALRVAAERVEHISDLDSESTQRALKWLETERELISHGLVLHGAGLSAIGGMPEDRFQMVFALGCAQDQLLRNGWSAALEGRYVSAFQQVRLTDELSEYMIAVSLDEAYADRLWADKFGYGDARQVVEERLMAVDGAGAERWGIWAKVRKDHLHAGAHTGSQLLLAAGYRRRPGQVGIDPTPDMEMVARSGAIYCSLMFHAVAAMRVILWDYLDHRGAWVRRWLAVQQLYQKWDPKRPRPPHG